jgi:hypothetical protein
VNERLKRYQRKLPSSPRRPLSVLRSVDLEPVEQPDAREWKRIQSAALVVVTCTVAVALAVTAALIWGTP